MAYNVGEHDQIWYNAESPSDHGQVDFTLEAVEWEFDKGEKAP